MNTSYRKLSFTKLMIVPHSENVCSICLLRTESPSDLCHLNDTYICNIRFEDDGIQFTLCDAVSATLGCNTLETLKTNVICKKCTNTILKSYTLLKRIMYNHSIRDQLHISENAVSVTAPILNTGNTKKSSIININASINKKSQDCPLNSSSNNNITEYNAGVFITDNAIEKSTIEYDIIEDSTNDGVKDTEDQSIVNVEFVVGAANDSFDQLIDENLQRKISKAKFVDTGINGKNSLNKPKVLPPAFLNIEEYSTDLCGTGVTPTYVIKRDENFKNTIPISTINEIIQNQGTVLILSDDETLDKLQSQETDRNAENIQQLENIDKIEGNEIELPVQSDGETNLDECPYCETLINKSVYKEHVITHLENVKIGIIPEVCGNMRVKRCPFCSYCIIVKDYFEGHINRHHLDVAPYQCDQCGNKFAAEYLLQSHKRKSHKNVRYKCSYCGKELYTRAGIQIHMRTHLRVLPYKCDFCDKKFVSQFAKTCHMKKVHMNPSFVCNYCGKKFVFNLGFKRHLADVHGVGEKTKRKRKIRPTDPIYMCEFCGKKLFYTANIKRHLNDVHGIGERSKLRTKRGTKLKAKYLSK